MNVSLILVLLFGLNLGDGGTDTVKTDTPKEEEACVITNNVFAPGEKMVFKVYYTLSSLWVGAGEVVFNVNQEKYNNLDAYHIVVTGRTYKFYEKIYRVRDKYESYMDPTTLQPMLFRRDVDEGGYIIKHEYEFNHDESEVTARDLHKNQEDSISVPSCIHDAVSAIYYARCIDFDRYEPGDKLPISVFIDNKTYDLYIRYLGKEVLRTKMGKIKCVKFAPLMLNNEYFDGGEHMVVWATDDKNRLPVRIESPLSVGSIKANLQSFSGLKHEFEASLRK